MRKEEDGVHTGARGYPTEVSCMIHPIDVVSNHQHQMSYVAHGQRQVMRVDIVGFSDVDALLFEVLALGIVLT
jgi:hypothetical protein